MLFDMKIPHWVVTNGVVISVSAKRIDVDSLLVKLLVGHHGLVLSGEGALAASMVREAGIRRRGLHLVNQVSAGAPEVGHGEQREA